MTDLAVHAPALHDALVQAYDLEVARRVPGLRRAVRRLSKQGSAVPASCVRTVVTHVHALAASAVVVGAHAVAREARACEQRLLAYVDGEPMPSVVVADAVDAIHRLLSHLDRLPTAATG